MTCSCEKKKDCSCDSSKIYTESSTIQAISFQIKELFPQAKVTRMGSSTVIKDIALTEKQVASLVIPFKDVFNIDATIDMLVWKYIDNGEHKYVARKIYEISKLYLCKNIYQKINERQLQILTTYPTNDNSLNIQLSDVWDSIFEDEITKLANDKSTYGYPKIVTYISLSTKTCGEATC